MRRVFALSMALLGSGPALADDAPGPTDPVIGRYLADLEKSRRLPAENATPEMLRARLAAAEEHLVRGDPQAATTVLYGLVESPRFAPLRDEVPYQNAEFLLGRALLRAKAVVSSERYLLRVLTRGPQSPYFVPAHRSLIDLALETRQTTRVLGVLEALKLNGPLSADAAHERAYLRGRAAYEGGDLDAAARQLAEVGRSSRLYASAAYFRGLIAARRGAYKDARGAFCELASPKNKDTLAFNIDGRYFALQDLARLALGRIAHEQDRYDEAYYFYFSVPEDSDRLAEALFEAAWSMYQKGEFRAARAFVEAFDQSFPTSPLRPDVAVLRANVALKSCNFDLARAEVAAVVQTYGPLQKQAARAIAEPARRRALVARLLSRPASLGVATDDDGRLLSLLKLDARFAALLETVREVEADLADARLSIARWATLGEVARGGGVQRAVASAEAAQLLEDVLALVPLAVEEPELVPRLDALLVDASLAAHPPTPSGPYVAEQETARELARKLGALKAELLGAADALALGALRELDERLRATFRQGRLVHIDAVVGHKKRLEIEIENLQAGRLPASLYSKLKAEGTLGDDEEYWPFEGEFWADEYENYR